MNEQGTQARPADADARSIKVALRRPPDELAAQLDRDATSLQLTADTIAPADARFYQGAAAAMREAAAFLKSWEPRLKAKEDRHRIELAEAQAATFTDAILSAQSIQQAVARADSMGGHAWAAACEAIMQVLMARRQATWRLARPAEAQS